MENGETSKEGSDAGHDESKEEDVAVVVEEKNEVKEDNKEEEKVVESGVDNHCESIEHAEDGEATEEGGEGENLIKEERGEKGKEKEGKKSKKKEGNRWTCGLGKKSSKEKSEKKKKEDKKGKKGKKSNVDEEQDGLPENEKKLLDGEDDVNEETDKNEDKENDAKDEEKNECIGESNENDKNEEVVVYVTESEAVVEETHHSEASSEECSVKGEGLVKGIRGQEASFQIHLLVDNVFSFTCKIQDANGNEVAAEIEHVEGSTHKATYHPSTTGIHIIEALWKGQPISGSPFQVDIAENGDT